MPTKTFSASRPGPVTLAVHADAAILDVTTSPQTATAAATITGPAAVTGHARAELAGDTWTLTLPKASGPAGTTIINASGSATVIHGRILTGGPVVIGGGRVIVNGVDVTSAVSGRDAGPARITVRLPAGSSLDTDVAAGQVTARGALTHVRAAAVSADLDAESAATVNARTVSGDITIRRLTGPASVCAVSGDITLTQAAGAVSAQTTSGDVTVHAIAPVSVQAHSVSGDVRVTAGTQVTPMVRAGSVSGRVICPPGGRQ